MSDCTNVDAPPAPELHDVQAWDQSAGTLTIKGTLDGVDGDFSAHVSWPPLSITTEERRETYDRPFTARLKSGAGFDHVLLARVAAFIHEVHHAGITETIGPECHMAVLLPTTEHVVRGEAGALANAIGYAPSLRHGLQAGRAFSCASE